MGPSHPSTHGVLRLQMELDGEVVTKADPVIGYLHRGDEKIAENMTYNQFVPYTDRLDYLAPLANNMAYAIAVERLAKLEVPPRCQAIRVITAEMARISSHLMGLGAFGIDVGAWTVFLYSFTEREKLYKLFEELTGARFTTSYTRIGGVARDVPDGLDRTGCTPSATSSCPMLEEILSLLTRNKIFMDRTAGIGVISKEDAIAYGLTGPNLRGSGVPLDLRKDRPYSGYEQYEFDVPGGHARATRYDRYLVRGEEMRQSVRIIRQAVAKFPGGQVVRRGRQAHLRAAQGQGAHLHGGADPELHDRHRGAADAGGRGVLRGGEPQGRPRLLRRLARAAASPGGSRSAPPRSATSRSCPRCASGPWCPTSCPSWARSTS